MAGIGEFYGGILHPLLVPAHALALVLLALLAGQGGMGGLRRCHLGFLPALALGLVLAGTGMGPKFSPEPPLLLTSALAGLLVVLQWRPPMPVFYAAGAGVGLLLGLDSAPEGLAPGPAAASLLGTGLGAFVCLLLLADLSDRARQDWQRIALRVLGSWGTASATLVFALGRLSA
jgi:urease accessory protein